MESISANFVFQEYDLDSVLHSQHQQAKEKIESLVEKQLSLESLENLVQGMAEQFKVNPIILIEGAISVSVEETKVDVSHERNRFIIDRSKPFLIPGIRVDYYIPYSGDKILFRCRPSTFNSNPPNAHITDTEVLISQSIAGTDAALTRVYFDSQLSNLKQYLGWQSAQVEHFNKSLSPFFRSQIENRISRVKATQVSVSGIGFPIRRQSQPSTTPPVPKASPNKNRPTSQSDTIIYDVSLSFAGEDRVFVDHIANLLKDAGVKVFYDAFEKASLWGTNLIDHLGDIYRNRSRFVVMFVSKHYVDKAWPTHERQHAQARALFAKEAYILPARFDDTIVPGMTDSVLFIDLRTTTTEELVQLILTKLQKVGPA